MVSLKNIIAHILQEHGFDVYEKEQILFGEKGDQLVSVGIYEDSTLNNVRDYAEAVQNVDGTHIFCVPGEVGDEAQSYARERGIQIWNREDLEREIGRAIITHAATDNASSFRELIQARMPEDETTREMDISEEAGSDISGKIEVTDISDVIISKASESLPVYVEGLGSEDATKVVKMRLTLDDVKEISGKTVQGFKHDLELVPHYLFEYLCIFEGRDGEERKNRGIIAVNAFTGKYSEWEDEPEFTDDMSNAHVQLEPKVDESAATKAAMQAVMETNREHDEVIVERDHATIIEKAVFAPKEENVVLEKRGLVMVPVWCVEGSHGVMILDGMTGKIISEDYYQESRE